MIRQEATTADNGNQHDWHGLEAGRPVSEDAWHLPFVLG
jgi:hypothetical protein